MAEGRYAYFWGCQIPARLPFMEKSTRLVLERLGVEARDLDGFTCCPEKALVKNLSHEGWLLAAARNLALAEAQGLDIIAPCNGCYGTLKGAATELNDDHALRASVNERLAGVGLQYKGHIHVRHLIEVLHDEVGVVKIRAALETPLTGLRVAVHNGCHLTRPSTAVHFDDPLHPVKYDALVEALGATSIDYHTKMMCCGGALGNVGEADDSLALTRKKLLEVQSRQADCLTTVCPSCFMQYDQKQYIAQRQGENLHVPVFTYPELLGLTLGFTPQELGLDMHRVDTESFFQRWEKRRQDFTEVKRHLDLNAVRNCYQCGACVADCPVAETSADFQPNQLIGQLLEGRIEELLGSRAIWKCLECHTCYELCPQKFGMERVFTTLKHLAMSRGQMPPSIKGAVDLYKKTGRLAAPDQKARARLGLGEAPASGAADLQKLLAGLDYRHPRE